MTAPLAGLRVFDLTRILAGPTCTQLLGDLGAEVIKIERPGQGDDTRKWGPPYVQDAAGNDTETSAYYLSANRNKRSVTLDIATQEGQRLARQLIQQSDIVVENFKTGGLKKYGLSYDDVKEIAPHIIFCSITGFGQTGPYASRAGYDYLAQGMGGIMSLTGEPEGEPMKVGVGIADLMCGMYASSAILAALHHREKTGEGQHIDLALLDTQVSWLTYEGLNYLTSGDLPKRRGNEHPNIVPYKTMPASDGYFILAVGNDSQFAKFCAEAGSPELAEEPRFATNAARVRNRDALYPLLDAITAKREMQDWVDALNARGVPCGPVNTVDRVFADPQVQHRKMQIQMDYPDAGNGRIDLIGNPIGFSQTPVSYRQHPPKMGEHTDAVLQEALGLDAEAITRLRDQGVI
ncbi:CaiB/BaiF CoA transferase family protein [Rhodovibrio salinarum]|uniref:CoA transferase n=1 Tax=Rhodovibrio salinarum TaxID=1087 RepID=A0A934UXM0_9PROT|nr:CaiB/BaiF CoA-transferase family protein [Rhodovibrio salinarum]MBK1695682.1 CoA transferase [Rhodovibrio salinarum]